MHPCLRHGGQLLGPGGVQPQYMPSVTSRRLCLFVQQTAQTNCCMCHGRPSPASSTGRWREPPEAECPALPPVATSNSACMSTLQHAKPKPSPIRSAAEAEDSCFCKSSARGLQCVRCKYLTPLDGNTKTVLKCYTNHSSSPQGKAA